jgi:RHS repeat-associated protein
LAGRSTAWPSRPTDYDASLRLTRETYRDPSGAVQEEIVYGYDSAGDRITLSDSRGTHNYGYAPGYQLVNVDGSGGDHESYGYDADGRVSSVSRDGGTLALEHNTADSLTAVADPVQGARIDYTYDGLGQRVRATGQGNDRRFLVAPAAVGGVDSPQLILDAGGGLVAGYVYAADHPFMRFGPDGPVYYLEDGLGSTIALADGTGSQTARFTYDGFGNLRSASGPAAALPPAAGGDFRFQGGWLESATGFYALGARDYDPRTGRFLSKDPADPVLTEPESLHPYAFAGSNPYLYHDPSGGFFTLVSISISSSIEDNLQAVQTAGANYLRQLFRNKLSEALGNVVLDTIKSFVPGFEGVENILRSGNPFQQGRALEALIKGTLRSKAGPFAGIVSKIFFEVPINDQGEPQGNGLNVSNYNTGNPFKGYNSRLNSFPDLIASDTPPADLPKTGDRSWVIGDIKRSVQGIRASRNQYRRILAHAAN